MIIGYDLDNTLWNLVENSLIYYNKDYDDNVKLEDLTEYNMEGKLKMPVDEFFEKYAQEPYIDTLEVYKESFESIQQFINDGHKIVFVSASYPSTIKWRDKKLKEIFSWYETSDLIICHKKQLLKIDILIDDCLDNLIGGDYGRLLVDMPWNRGINNDKELRLVRVNVR